MVVVLQQNQSHVTTARIQRHPSLDSSLDLADEWVDLLVFLHESGRLTEDGSYHWEEAALPHSSVAQDLHGVGFSPESQQA